MAGRLGQDWHRNAGQPQIQVLLVLFRLAQAARTHSGPLRRLAPATTLLYRWPALFMVGLDMPVSTRIGPGLAVHHGIGTVVHAGAELGRNVTLRQNVTVGSKAAGAPAPRLGDGVDVGAGASIIGDIAIGAGARIGAGAVVLVPVPAGATAVGNPGRVLTATQTPPSKEPA